MTDSVDPPILSHIPPGTRPHRYACMTVAPEVGQRGIEFAREELIHRADERPHVVITLDADTARRWFKWETTIPGARVVAAIQLAALPGALEHIVIRRADNVPADAFPGWEGRWQPRPSSPYGVVMLAGVASSDLFAPVVKVEARSTGRVEIREDGALAEVFEYGPLPEIDGSWRP